MSLFYIDVIKTVMKILHKKFNVKKALFCPENVIYLITF